MKCGDSLYHRDVVPRELRFPDSPWSYSDLQPSPSNDRPRDTKTLSSMDVDAMPSSGSDIPIAEDAVRDEPQSSPVDESGRNSVPGDFRNPSSEGPVEFRESVNEGFEAQRRVLPDELARGVVMLSCDSSAEGGSCDVYLIGTAHASQESCRQVQAVISHLKPQVVFLELCPSRVAILTPQILKAPTMREIIGYWKQKNSNMFGIVYTWFLAKVAHKLDVFPGSEFRVAFQEALKYGGKVILGDRPVHITMRRIWGKMSLWHKLKFLYEMLAQALTMPDPDDLNGMLKQMDDADMLTFVIQKMSKNFPTLLETLVYERDMYMSSTLLRVAEKHASVVAVVGKMHLLGIQKHWKQPIVMKDLLEIPARKSSALKIAATVGVAVTGAAIISSFFTGGKR